MTPLRMSGLDASLLAHETLGSGVKTEIVGLYLFSGSPPAWEAILGELERRTLRLRRFRQRLVRSPLRITRPFWVDDADFDIRNHILCHPLPEGSGEEGLRRFADELLSEQLDRTRPMWRLYFVPTGLDDGRWAVVTKYSLHIGRVRSKIGRAHG